MLDVMRKHAQSWLIKAIFAIIIVVFVLFWTDPREQGTGLQVVATVDGSEITLSEYRRAYDNLMNVYRNVFREGLTDEILKTMKVSEKAIDSLIDKRLLLKEAGILGLKVSDSELVESISKYPAFQKDNFFDKGLYMAVLRANRMTPEEFEESQRKNLLTDKVEKLIQEGVKVADEEVWEAYAGEKEKINLELVKIEPGTFLKDAKISEDEAKEYFSKNKEDFRLPAAVKIEFITITKEYAEKSVSPDEDDLRNFYEKNIDLFMKPEKDAGARPFDEVMGQVAVMFRSERAEEVVTELAYRIREDADKSKDLEAISTAENLPLTRTPFFSSGDQIEGLEAGPDFYREAFLLKAGEISQPVKVPAGYVVLKVTERKDARIPEFDEVRDRVISIMAKKKAEETAVKKGEEILAGLKEGKFSLARLPYKPFESGLFSRGGSIPRAGFSEGMGKAAFALTKEQPFPDKPFIVNGAVYLMKLKERVDADRDGFKTEEPSVRSRILQKKGEEALKSWLRIARTRSKVTVYDDLLQ